LNINNNILAFHDVSDHFELSITRIGIKRFERIIAYLQEIGKNITSLDKLSSETDIAFTFDDGWDSFYLNVYPLLKKHGITATVYIIADYVGSSSGWDYKNRVHLNWKQIKELSEFGIEIGSHSASHIDLRTLSQDKLKYEIAGSKQKLEDKLGVKIKSFSYPFGRFDQKAIEAVCNAGYDNGCALSIDEGEFARARKGVYMYDTPYSIDLKLNRFSRLESYKEYINNLLAGGTILLRKLFPAGRRQ